jgi:hypothetical protein
VLQQLALRFGRRGLKLMILGTGFFAFGLTVVLGPHTERFSRAGPSPLDWADSRGWGWLFLAGGLVAVVVGRGRRYAPDAIGFTTLVIPATVWALFYGYSTLVWIATAGAYGEPRTWTGLIIWSVIATSIRIDAGWDDPTDPLDGSQDEP